MKFFYLIALMNIPWHNEGKRFNLFPFDRCVQNCVCFWLFPELTEFFQVLLNVVALTELAEAKNPSSAMASGVSFANKGLQYFG